MKQYWPNSKLIDLWKKDRYNKEERIKILTEIYTHDFEAGNISPNLCRKCGLDARDPLHVHL